MFPTDIYSGTCAVAMGDTCFWGGVQDNRCGVDDQAEHFGHQDPRSTCWIQNMYNASSALTSFTVYVVYSVSVKIYDDM